MEENVGKTKAHETPVKNPHGAELTIGSGSGVSEQPDMLQKIKALEEENHNMLKSFDSQRAKLKELYVQKVRELDEVKTSMVVAEIKAQEEISSLQQLVQETIEESSNYKADLERLEGENSRLWQENRELRDNLAQHQSPASQELSSLAPQMLSQVKKTLVRKLGGDAGGSVLGSSFTQESLDDTRNKSEGKYAHEDSEVLGSIVTQLQEEMKVLKEKLREADEKLQATSSSKPHLPSTAKAADNSTTQTENFPCSNCPTLENKIKELIEKATEDHNKIEDLQKKIGEFNEELSKEAALRHDLESQWEEKREAYKNEVHALREQVTASENRLLSMQQKFLEAKDDIMRQLHRVSDDREKINKHLEVLQADNDFLSGRYLATAEEIENQHINLPNTVEELQELILKQQQELIKSRLGCDFERKRCVTSLDEIQILRDQLEATDRQHSAYKKKYQAEIKSLQERITLHLQTLQKCETSKTDLERKESELNRKLSAFRVEIIELQEQNEKLAKSYAEAKAKIKTLQDDLATSEQVQKDFVQLSQTLQMTLENLRHADTEVRWQDDDDVPNCPKCNVNFTVTVRKTHCRHCGRIYCDKCLTKSVPSGPRKRLARVCDICHTLLSPHIAPYFSQDSAQLQTAANSS
uniref:FYVE-type domain-containing protein n=1 Tax=Glossina palpalis gambiensis TaxID=67801 RepID=A0A1B0BEQ5_9MUSC